MKRAGFRFGVAAVLPWLVVTAASADTYTLQVRQDAGDTPIVTVTVEDFPDPKGLRYAITTTLADGPAARTYRADVTRRGGQWVADSVDGLKGGSFKKVAGIVTKAGAQVRKRFNGWAKLAPTPESRIALIERGKAVRAEMKADGKAMVAAVNAAPSFALEDLAVAQAAIAIRYYDWLYATLDAVRELGPKDKAGVGAHITTALDALYPRDDVGRCTAPAVPTFRMDSEDCPPDDFVPAGEVALSRECYGKKGLYQDQDFKCSAGAPQGTFVFTSKGAKFVDFRACCLEHDRAFFCGGVSSSGQPTGTGPGSWAAWQAANASLMSCIGQAIINGYVANGNAPNHLVAGLWRLYFSFTGNVFIWGDSTLVGDAWANGWNNPAILAGRLDTCICGGDEPVPLCGNHCMVNDCSEPLPAMLDEAAFEDQCDDTCMWTCVEEYEDGELHEALQAQAHLRRQRQRRRHRRAVRLQRLHTHVRDAVRLCALRAAAAARGRPVPDPVRLLQRVLPAHRAERQHGEPVGRARHRIRSGCRASPRCRAHMLVAARRRDVAEHVVDHPARLRPVAAVVRVVGRPHDVVDADRVAVLRPRSGRS